jgi:uncharacterized small protein (DUF1192 family)
MPDPSLLEDLPERAKTGAAIAGIGTWLYLAAKSMLRNDRRQDATDRRRDAADKITGDTYTQTIALLKEEVARMAAEIKNLGDEVKSYRDQCLNCRLWQEARKLRDCDVPKDTPHA